MARYRKKPVVIEAFQVPPNGEMCSDEMAYFLQTAERDVESSYDGVLLIHTLEGTMEALPGDWIIKGVQGEIYPCKPDIFTATYELVKD